MIDEPSGRAETAQSVQTGTQLSVSRGLADWLPDRRSLTAARDQS